jgi:hypothetical protein
MEHRAQNSSAYRVHDEPLGQASPLAIASRVRDPQIQLAAEDLYQLIDRIARTTDMLERIALFRSLHTLAVLLEELRTGYDLSAD